MLLEIPSQIGLAGKVQVVRYLLHGHFRGTQQHLCLQYDMPVYNGLRRLARHLPGDSGEITGRDTKLVRIERDLFLVEIMGMDAIDELMEQLLPTVAPILLAAREGVPCLIIHIKEEALQLVFHDHITVHVIPIHVNQPKQPDDHIYGLLLIGGMRIARAILYEAEKGGSSRNTASSNKTFEKDIYCTLKSSLLAFNVRIVSGINTITVLRRISHRLKSTDIFAVPL